MTARAALAIVLAAAAGGFGWLVIALLTGAVDLRHLTGPGRALRRRLSGPDGRRLLAMLAVGVLVLGVTRWVAVALACAVVVGAWPAMFGAARQQQAVIGRLEALATWIESLRDTIATGTALPEAILATSASPPASLQRPLGDVVARMQAREPLAGALLGLADDLDDAVADQAIGALVLNAREQGKRLKVVLGALAVATRNQVSARRDVEADRRSMRQSVRIIMIVTVLVVMGLALLNPGYVEPFSTFTGQIVLGVAVGCFAAGFWWMHRLSSFKAPGRFLAAEPVSAGTHPATEPAWTPAVSSNR